MGLAPLLDCQQAASCIARGGVIAYPTEAVFGLGCDPDNESAVRRILELKSRPAEAGLILIADEFSRFESFVQPVSPADLERARSRWPGPVSWLFPRSSKVPDWLAGRHPTIAIRVTAHPLCRDLCAKLGGAIVSTSANPGGEEPARSSREVLAYFKDRIDGVLEGPLGEQENPSEIRDLASGKLVRGG